CSPMAQRMASTTLLLPQPFGPTTPVTPSSKEKTTRSAKDLKPEISTRRIFIVRASEPRNTRPPQARSARAGAGNGGAVLVAEAELPARPPAAVIDAHARALPEAGRRAGGRGDEQLRA